jgi:nitrile hydratase
MKLVEQHKISDDDLARWLNVFEQDDAAPIPVTSDPELVARIGEMRSAVFEPAPDARFAVGDRVRVIRMRPPGHHRCPRYVRGATGTIERLLGADLVPGLPPGDPTVEPVYTVEFSSVALFGPSNASDRSHTILIDLVERYLEAAR